MVETVSRTQSRRNNWAKPFLTGIFAIGLCFGTFVTEARADEDTVAAGEREFKKLCGLCHTVAEDGRHRVGPNLYGIMDRVAGAPEGFRFSPAHKDSGFVFSAEGMDAYLADYVGTMPGTKKSISGIKDEERRASIIAYLIAVTSQ